MASTGPASTTWDELELPAEVVTGEAVALELRPASFATRALAILLDLVIQVAALIALFALVGVAMFGLDDAAGAAAGLAVMIGVLVVLPVTVETASRGRSLGKLVAGLRVVRDDGGPIRFRQALVRGLIGAFELYLLFGSVALICSLASPRGKRLGDMLAGTYVIRDRAGHQTIPPVPMPPQLAGWVRAADLGRIPDPLAVTARQFLYRASGLHPASRDRLGRELAARIGPYVAPLPPAGVHPEPFLAAVLAERRERDLARLQAEQRARLDRERRRATAPLLSPGGTALVGDPDGSSS
jgi:uncharacterized RDD family membrane protein YckC